MSFSRGDVVAGAFEVERSLDSDVAMDFCRARQLLSGKRVALKVLRLSVGWCDAVIERAAKLEQITGDTFTACIFQGSAGRGRWCFAFEWAPSDQPENRLPRRATPDRTALIGASVADGLAALHEQGIVHGHVRPERVVMAGKESDTPKLLDFVVSPDRALITANARYVAPEIILGSPPSSAGDVYGLGVMLWELLSGRAFCASESRIGVFLTTLFDTPDRALSGDASLASWVTRMMAREPLERPEARQVEIALRTMFEGGSLPLLAAPSSRDQIAGRAEAALAVLVIRPPAGKDPKAVGLGDDWRRDVEGLGAQLTTLPEGTLLGQIRGHTPHAVATSVALVAAATQEHAFRASVVSGLIHAGGVDHDMAASRAELLDTAALATRTPAGVTRFTARLAEHVGTSVGLKPSGDSFLLVPRPASKPKRGGTLEIEVKAKTGSGKKRKTGEIELGEQRAARGKGGTLVIEPGPERAEQEAEPKRGKGGTLVLEPERPGAAISNGAAAEAPRTASPNVAVDVVAAPASTFDHGEETRVGPLPSEEVWAKAQLDIDPHTEDTPTLKIEVSSELVEKSRTDMELRVKKTDDADAKSQ